MRLAVFGAIALLWVGAAFAQSSPPTSPATKQFSEDMQTYFRHPAPKIMVDRLATLPSADFSKPELPYLVGAFFCHLIDASPDTADLLVDRAVNGGRELKAVVVQSLAFSHHPRRTELIDRVGGSAATKGLAATGTDFRSIRITHPAHLDMLWASFFATGDGVYVERITETLNRFQSEERLRELSARAKNDPSVNETIRDGLIGQAAAWSLNANGRKIPEVRAALANYVARTNDPLAGVILMKIPPQ